ncbi:hypothetical protein, partial [Corynebacterium nasicanis]
MSLSASLRRSLLATVATTSLLAAGTTLALPAAQAQNAPALWGTGYVDIVGRDYHPDTATWSASVRPFGSADEAYEHRVTQRIVIPKTVGEPSLVNGQWRGNFRSAEALPAHPDVAFAKQAADHLLEYGARHELLARVSERLTAEHPESLLQISPYLLNYSTHDSHMLDGLGGLTWTADYNDGLVRGSVDGTVEDENWEFLLDHEGNLVKLLSAVPSTTEPGAPIRVTYLSVPQDIHNTVVQDFFLTPGTQNIQFEADERMHRGVSTNLERVIHEVLIDPADFPTLDRLPAPTRSVAVDSPSVIERDIRATNRILAEELGLADPGALTVEMAGAIFGDMVLTKNSSPVDTTKVTGVQFPHFEETDNTIYYTVTDSPVNADGTSHYWVIDIFGPRSQFSFDVTAPKLPAGTTSDEYVAAQIYHKSTCTRWGNDLNWQCQELHDYSWGKGLNLESTYAAGTVLTDGVVRGTLTITESAAGLSGLERDRHYQRGIFGNDYCMVTRPTEDPTDFQALASTILPSDYNNRFPGQQENTVSPSNRFLRGEQFSDDIPMRNVNDGEPFTSADGCDQAGVRLAAPAATPPGGSSLLGSALLIGGSALLSSGSGSAAPDDTPVPDPTPAQTTIAPQPTPSAEPTPV